MTSQALPAAEAEDWVPDPASQVAHKLISSHLKDGSEPFMIAGNPNLGETDRRIVRSCFYYAIAMTAKFTVLFDNHGKGGMCDMLGDEISSVWSTPELLASLGTDFASLKNGTAVIIDGDIPSAVFDADLNALKDKMDPEITLNGGMSP